MKPIPLKPLLVLAMSLGTPLYGANILVDGTNSNQTFNAFDGVGTVASIIDGTVTDNQSTFSQEIVTVGEGVEVVSDAVQISSIPVVEVAGAFHFRLLYDSQESGNANRNLNIVTLQFYADASDSLADPTIDGTLIWDLDVPSIDPPQQIELNPLSTTDTTDSPSGNGADFALLIPVDTLIGWNTDDYLYLATEQLNSDNGRDEWVLADGATLPGGTIITPGITPIPEPSSVFLTAFGSLLLIFRRRR